MPAYPDPQLAACDDPAAWIASAAEYARLQVAAIDAARDLVACGVPLRTATDLQTAMDELLSDRMSSTRRSPASGTMSWGPCATHFLGSPK